VSERSVQRGAVPSLRSLRGVKNTPSVRPVEAWGDADRPTVAIGVGKMSDAERPRSRKWKSRIIYHTLKNNWVFEDFPNFVLRDATA